jgi:ATP-dependent DNA helicase RecG
MTIEEILAGESKNVEFKENLPEKSIKYMKSVVAFANGTGGKIIFGIADKSREVVGFDKEEVFKIMDAIANAVADNCEPAHYKYSFHLFPYQYLLSLDSFLHGELIP